MRAALLVLSILWTGSAWAQAQPGGSSVLNQGLAARVITPSDTTVIGPTRAIYNGNGSTACNIAVLMESDSVAVTFSNVPAGPLPINVAKVMATGTTCTPLVALY